MPPRALRTALGPTVAAAMALTVRAPLPPGPSAGGPAPRGCGGDPHGAGAPKRSGPHGGGSGPQGAGGTLPPRAPWRAYRKLRDQQAIDRNLIQHLIGIHQLIVYTYTYTYTYTYIYTT